MGPGKPQASDRLKAAGLLLILGGLALVIGPAVAMIATPGVEISIQFLDGPLVLMPSAMPWVLAVGLATTAAGYWTLAGRSLLVGRVAAFAWIIGGAALFYAHRQVSGLAFGVIVTLLFGWRRREAPSSQP